MSTEWFFTRDGREMGGPFTTEKLKELACTGQVLPTDKIRKGGTKKKVTAQKLKALFAPRGGV